LLQALERVLSSKWEEFGCSGSRPERFLFILSTERHWHSKTVLHCLPDDHTAQPVIVKVQRDDLHLPLLENEYLRLKSLHGHEGVQGFRRSIPRPLFFGRIGGHLALIETFVPGVPFSKHSRRRDPELFLELSNWLSALHARTRLAARSMTEKEMGAHFLDPLESAIRALEGRRSVQLLLDGFRQRMEELSRAGLPFVFSHNDLCMNNIRFQGDRVGVIDWEFSRGPDLPLHDLINAFLFFGMTWRRLSYTEAFRLAFSPDDGLHILLKRCVRRYVRDLGVSPAAIPLLVVQYLLSRIPLLQSIGNMTSCEETIECLQAVAEGRVDLDIWNGLGPSD
jgi:hypothetical protein